MSILFNSMMTATRMDGFSHIPPKTSRKPRRFFRIFKAYSELHKFRALDVALLRDVGLSQADADRATLGDFMRQPHR